MWHHTAGEFCTLGWGVRLWAHGIHQFGRSLSLSSRQQLRYDILYSWGAELDWSSQDRSHTRSGQGRPTICVHTQRPVYCSVYIAAWLLMLKLTFCCYIHGDSGVVLRISLCWFDLITANRWACSWVCRLWTQRGQAAARLKQTQHCSTTYKHVSLTAICQMSSFERPYQCLGYFRC